MTHRVELRTYFRILTCAVVAGAYFSLSVVALVLFVNPELPESISLLAHLAFYIIPIYSVIVTLGFGLVLFGLQPLLIGPLARRAFDPVLLSRLLLADLTVMGLVFWLNAYQSQYLLSPRQQAHLVRGCVGITVVFALVLTAHSFQSLYPVRRKAARLVLVILAAGLQYFLFAQRTQSHTPARRHTIVLDVAAQPIPMKVIAVDGLTFELLRPMQAAGKLPNFTRLMSEGVSARLRSVRPSTTPLTWTTLATGKLPFRHRVVDDFIFRFEGAQETFRVTPRFVFFRKMVYLGVLKALPVLTGDRKALAFWNILHRSGLDVGVVNWPVTYPAERIPVFVVSDYLSKSYFQFGRGLSRVVHPQRLERLALKHRIMPSEIPNAIINAMIPIGGADVDTEKDSVLRGHIRKARASDLTTRSSGMIFSSLRRPDVLILRFDGLGIAERYFLKYHSPEAFGDVPTQEAQRYGGVSFVRPAMTRSVVVLPAPVGPNSTKNSPSSTLKETSRKAVTDLNCLVTSFSSTSAMMSLRYQRFL